MKKVLFILMLTIFAVVGCNQGTNDGKNDASTEQEQQAERDQLIHVVLMKSNGEEVLKEKDVYFAEGEKLLDVMERDFEIEHDNGYITSIDGIKADEAKKEAWFIMVNEEDAKVGAKDLELKNEDTIIFDLHKWE